MKKVLNIFGTRPEAIKMAPVVKELQKQSRSFRSYVCVTAQHRSMLDQVLEFFGIKPDYDLDLMQNDQTLFEITAKGLNGLGNVLEDCRPDLVCVQGDTTTAFIGALAAYYKGVRIAHIEAGLRSGNKYSPFPEEMNRTLIGHLADFHFAPTEGARNKLIKEGISENVFVVGNTVIDALFLGLSMIKERGDEKYRQFFNYLDWTRKIILVTGHRRENFGKPFEDICCAIREIAASHDDVQVVYPVHLNPNVRNTVNRYLGGVKNLHLIEPLSYPHLLWLLSNSFLVMTDSGGIQEEAPSLGKPVLVMRDVTERTEGIEAGTAKLVGTHRLKIIQETSALLTDRGAYEKMSKAHNPYGDGRTAVKIADALRA